MKKGYNRSNLSPHLNEFTTKDLVRGKLTATNECIKKISNNLIFNKKWNREFTMKLECLEKKLDNSNNRFNVELSRIE